MAKQFQRLVNSTNEVDNKSAFILDDTIHAKTGRRIVLMTKVFDHVAGKAGSKLGFKNLTLGLSDLFMPYHDYLPDSITFQYPTHVVVLIC
ncbi:hypothetical protein SBF1_2000003 [Candidatus Desulfosporosinus infrequens]|uniref:Transposase n=1 Tax=Candidatus Desulfosporosinus infrequens TaxID=2043169 RepID=A0A2U3KHW7_9FIRM|nr:hypothetical protein SBF1_2000003 [Candidatus Desulfosporosinus infrequens]